MYFDLLGRVTLLFNSWGNGGLSGRTVGFRGFVVGYTFVRGGGREVEYFVGVYSCLGVGGSFYLLYAFFENIRGSCRLG